MSRQLQLPLRYKPNKTRKTKKTRLELNIEVIMNALSVTTIIGILLSGSIVKLNNAQIWFILFILMGISLIKGLDEIVRVVISFVALSLFLADLIRVYPSLTVQIPTFLIVYIGLYLIVRRKFNLELIANSLAIGTAIKLLYLNWSWIAAYKINPNLILYGFVFIILLLLIPVVEDIGRLLIAMFATIGLMVSLFGQISLLNLLILLTALLIYLSFSFKLRGGI